MSIGYWETETFKVVNTACDKNGRILILDAELNDKNFLLINFNNSNSESEGFFIAKETLSLEVLFNVIFYQKKQF